jgi:hypothetical protein
MPKLLPDAFEQDEGRQVRHDRSQRSALATQLDQTPVERDHAFGLSNMPDAVEPGGLVRRFSDREPDLFRRSVGDE